MIGGSTRIVKIQEILSEYFDGKQLNKMLNPDEAVAIGATVQAGIISGSEAVADIDFTDVLPLSIGLRTRNSNKPGKENMLMDPILPKDTQYPCENTEDYYFAHWIRKGEIVVMQGEAKLAKDCHLIT